MAYAATAGRSLPAMTAAPGVLALQRALVWLGGVRMGLVFVPLLLTLFLLNVVYAIGAFPFLDKSEVANWIATSWYMAVTVIFFAMVISEDTEARLNMLRRGLVVGAMIAALAALGRYFNLVPGRAGLLEPVERAP